MTGRGRMLCPGRCRPRNACRVSHTTIAATHAPSRARWTIGNSSPAQSCCRRAAPIPACNRSAASSPTSDTPVRASCDEGAPAAEATAAATSAMHAAAKTSGCAIIGAATPRRPRSGRVPRHEIEPAVAEAVLLPEVPASGARQWCRLRACGGSPGTSPAPPGGSSGRCRTRSPGVSSKGRPPRAPPRGRRCCRYTRGRSPPAMRA